MKGAGRVVSTEEAKRIQDAKRMEWDKKNVRSKNEDSNVFPKKTRNTGQPESYYDTPWQVGERFQGREAGSYHYGSSSASSSRAGNTYWDRQSQSQQGQNNYDWYQKYQNDYWEPEAKRRAQPEQPLWINGEFQMTGETIYSSHNPDRGAGKGK